MDFLLFTISWMSFNIFLACIPVLAAFLLKQSKIVWQKCVLFVLWLVFLPNTIYLLTDLYHLFADWRKVPFIISLLTIPLYLVLIIVGIYTFIFALYPVDQLLRKKWKSLPLRTSVIFLLNLLVGVGMTLGRIERINSWELLTNFPKTLHAVLSVFISLPLLFITILFALAANVLYFSLERDGGISRLYNRMLHKIIRR